MNFSLSIFLVLVFKTIFLQRLNAVLIVDITLFLSRLINTYDTFNLRIFLLCFFVTINKR